VYDSYRYVHVYVLEYSVRTTVHVYSSGTRVPVVLRTKKWPTPSCLARSESPGCAVLEYHVTMRAGCF
jgi:hypothetical protein